MWPPAHYNMFKIRQFIVQQYNNVTITYLHVTSGDGPLAEAWLDGAPVIATQRHGPCSQQPCNQQPQQTHAQPNALCQQRMPCAYARRACSLHSTHAFCQQRTPHAHVLRQSLYARNVCNASNACPVQSCGRIGWHDPTHINPQGRDQCTTSCIARIQR